jgi:hypothetical protein
MITEKADSIAQVGISQVLKMSAVLIKDPERYIRGLIVSNKSLPGKKIEQEVIPILKAQAKVDRLQIARAILDVVQDLPLFKRYQAELDVGRSLNLFNSSEARIKAFSFEEDLLEDETPVRSQPITYKSSVSFQERQLELPI